MTAGGGCTGSDYNSRGPPPGRIVICHCEVLYYAHGSGLKIGPLQILHAFQLCCKGVTCCTLRAHETAEGIRQACLA